VAEFNRRAFIISVAVGDNKKESFEWCVVHLDEGGDTGGGSEVDEIDRSAKQR
jgi:hypothetical protein